MRAFAQVRVDDPVPGEEPVKARGWLGVIGGVILLVLLIEMVRWSRKQDS